MYNTYKISTSLSFNEILYKSLYFIYFIHSLPYIYPIYSIYNQKQMTVKSLLIKKNINEHNKKLQKTTK